MKKIYKVERLLYDEYDKKNKKNIAHYFAVGDLIEIMCNGGMAQYCGCIKEIDWDHLVIDNFGDKKPQIVKYSDISYIGNYSMSLEY